MTHTDRIILAIRSHVGPMPLAAIRQALPDISRATIDQTLSNLVRQDRLMRTGPARYTVPAGAVVTPAAEAPNSDETVDDQVGETAPTTDETPEPLVYSLWNDGEMVIKRGDVNITLSAPEVDGLAVLLAPRAS